MTEKTFIVLGCPRSGTSMVAGIMRILGVYMGEDVKEDKHEDTDFLWRDIEHIKQTISKRNAEHKVWGFKDPNCARYIEQILPLLVNPCYIRIERNNDDAIASDLARNENMKGDVAERRNARFNDIYDSIARCSNTLYLHYKDVIKAPEVAVQTIARFLGVYNENKEHKAVKFIAPGGYRTI